MKKTVVVIICHNSKLLFFQRDNISAIPDPGKWQFPGGHIESGESPEEAIKRELKEEVCFVPQSLKYVGAAKVLFKQTHIFWSFVDDKEAKRFKLGDEGQAIKFMAVAEALTHDLTKGVRFYLTNFKHVLLTHLQSETVPEISEIGRIEWTKMLFLELFGEK